MTDILKTTTFVGTIARAEQEFDATFHVNAGADFRLEIEVEPVPIAAGLALEKAMGEPGTATESLVLKGVSSDGAEFFSDAITLHGMQLGTQTALKIRARKATLTQKSDQAVPLPFTRLWMRSFRSFRNPPAEMSLGQLHVRGDSKPVSQDDISGSISLKALETTDLVNWRQRANAFLKFMLRGLAFGHGSRLQAPRWDYFYKDRIETIFIGGRAANPGFSTIPSLHQGPFIQALAKRFDAPKIFPDMIWTAIGWMNLDTTMDEARFLSAITALETIVEHLTPETQTTVVSKAEFAPIRDQLLDVVAQSGLSQNAKDILSARVKGINGRVLSQKVECLRDHYGLSAQKYDSANIVGAIKLRNAIVHTGMSEQDDIWPMILFVRDLIAEIVFSEIGYTGVHHSYFDGYKLVQPSMPTAPTEDIGVS